MVISPKKLREVLVTPGLIDRGDFEKALAKAEKKGSSIDVALIELGLISESHLGQIIANAYDWRFVELSKIKITNEMLSYINVVAAKSQLAIAFEKEGDVLKIATTNPENYPFFKLIEKSSGLTVEPYYAPTPVIKEAIKAYKSDLVGVVGKLIDDFQSGYKPEESVVKFIDLVLEYARDSRASDIHFEPLANYVSIRYRIDGIMHEVVQYPKAFHEKIIFRLKILSKLRTDEHAAAQDGRFTFNSGDVNFDVRLSILPIANGENVVLRLLSDSSQRLTLEDLGYKPNDLEKINRAAAKPYGMLLAVGPTGSGKTTTLYALLQILNQPDVNIVTIEDPIEYQLEHVQQTQINPKKNLTFANGLRSLVRQDPDIIMVGEIRDPETANIAVNIAMTGHLLLSTMHANDSATTFPRLIDMGIEPFLIASSINVVVAQRLARKICDKCKVSFSPDEKMIKRIEAEPELSDFLKKIGHKKNLDKMIFYKGQGCDYCGQTGFTGRIGVFEVMEVDDDLRLLINKKSSSEDIRALAVKKGMSTMLEDGIVKVFAGQTTIEEVLTSVKS
ncbi:MAG: type II/IV secretion system protein [Patescibacteria group bacterium]|nr:type II/IV secretion system protein [Patescibacteria group bacterium]